MKFEEWKVLEKRIEGHEGDEAGCVGEDGKLLLANNKNNCHEAKRGVIEASKCGRL